MQTRIVRAQAKDLSSFREFTSLTGIPGMAFWGSAADWQVYVALVNSREVVMTNATSIVGWTQDTFQTDKESLVGDTLEYLDTGINFLVVNENEVELTPQFMSDLVAHTRAVHHEGATLLILGWTLATVFAPQIRAAFHDEFPLLCLHGRPGVGKTTLARMFSRALLGTLSDLSGETTVAVVLRTLAGINALPVLIDEYESSKTFKSISLNSILRSLYVAGDAPRWSMDKGEAIRYKLQAPTMVTTITGFGDPALKDRAVNSRILPRVVNMLTLPSGEQVEDTHHRDWFDALPVGGFLRAWVKIDPQEIVGRIKDIARTIQASDRQRHAFGVVAAVLEYIGETWGIPGLTPQDIAPMWLASVEVMTTPVEALDSAMATAIRKAMLVSTDDYKIDGDMFFVNARALQDAIVQVAPKLDLPYPMTREWVRETIKEGKKTGEVVDDDARKYIAGRLQKVAVFSLDKMELTKEVLEP